MKKVYKDVTVIIAVVNASSVHFGFLGPRPSPPRIEVLFPYPGGQLCKFWPVERGEYSEEDSGPLYHRAWAM